MEACFGLDPRRHRRRRVGAAESDDTERVATRIPLRGQMENPEADIWTTVVYVLRNAFVEALNRGIEGTVGRR